MRRLSAILWAVLLFPLAAGAERQPAVPVTTASFANLARPVSHDLPANVASLNSATLSARISGEILAIGVRVGDRVKAGDALVTLDCNDAQIRQRTAQAGLDDSRAREAFARAQLGRARNLREQRSVSEELLEQRAMELRVAQATTRLQRAQVEQATLDVGRCTVSAPFAGLVRQRLAQRGALATPGTPLVELLQLDNSEVVVQLHEHQVAALRAASAPALHYAGAVYPLRLRTVLPVVDAQTRTREARLDFAAATAPPGAPGRLVWSSDARSLPADLLVRRNGVNGLFLVRAGKAVFHPLPEAQEGRPIRVSLPADTRLVVEGRQRVGDGDSVVPDSRDDAS